MRNLSLSGVVLLLMASAGCGEAGPELLPASGVVTLKSKPLAGATVTFIPEGKGSLGMAITDDEGKFDIKSGAKRGVVAGTSAVTVTLPAGAGNALSSNMTPEDMMKMQMEGKLQSEMDKQKTSLIPDRYSKADTSGLTVEVKSGQTEYNLTLE